MFHTQTPLYACYPYAYVIISQNLIARNKNVATQKEIKSQPSIKIVFTFKMMIKKYQKTIFSNDFIEMINDGR